MIRTFIETRYFTKKWYLLGFNDDDMRELQDYLLDDPKCGDVMSGTGGLRKIRFAFQHRGKSGIARVCYIDRETHSEVHFIDVFSKGEKENLSAKERSNIKKLVEYIKKYG